MSIFNEDIITSSLLVRQVYNIKMRFTNCSYLVLDEVFYNEKLWKDDIDNAQRIICDVFKEVTIDDFNVWVEEIKKGLLRHLRRFLKRHWVRPNMVNKFEFYKLLEADLTYTYVIQFSIPREDSWDYGLKRFVHTPNAIVEIMFEQIDECI